MKLRDGVYFIPVDENFNSEMFSDMMIHYGFSDGWFQVEDGIVCAEDIHEDLKCEVEKNRYWRTNEN